MQENLPDDYYNFFLELPPTDYLNDIEIQDEYESQTDDAAKGLSDEQVSQIAVDSLSEAKRLKSQPGQTQNETVPPKK